MSLGARGLPGVALLCPPLPTRSPSPTSRHQKPAGWLCPRHGSGQEKGIFCELWAWSLLMPISVSACLELQGQQASVILVAKGSGLETLRMWDKSQSQRGGILSLNGEEMGFHSSSMGPCSLEGRAFWGLDKEEEERKQNPGLSLTTPAHCTVSQAADWGAGSREKREGGEWALSLLGFYTF